jgi:hypothetical protein
MKDGADHVDFNASAQAGTPTLLFLALNTSAQRRQHCPMPAKGSPACTATLPKKPSRAAARLCAVETACAILIVWRAVADRLLEGLTPLKNVAHGLMRT